MGGKNNGRTGRILHPLWTAVRLWGEDPEHSPDPMESRTDGKCQVLESRVSGQPGEPGGNQVLERLVKDLKRERLTERCRALQRFLVPLPYLVQESFRIQSFYVNT